MPDADGLVQLPQTLPLTGACLDERGAFLLDNGRVMLLWLGRMLDQAWALEVRWACGCAGVQGRAGLDVRAWLWLGGVRGGRAGQGRGCALWAGC